MIAAPYFCARTSSTTPAVVARAFRDRPRSNDYVPIFPWFGAVLIGIAVTKIAELARPSERLAALRAPRWSSAALLSVAQPRLLSHPSAGPDRLYLAILPVIPGHRRRRRKSASATLRSSMRRFPRRGVLRALLCLHARHPGARERDRRRLCRRPERRIAEPGGGHRRPLYDRHR